MGAIVSFPTKRKRSYPNPWVKPDDLPEGVDYLDDHRRPEQHVVPRTGITVMLMAMFLAMTAEQRERTLNVLEDGCRRDPEDDELRRAYRLASRLHWGS